MQLKSDLIGAPCLDRPRQRGAYWYLLQLVFTKATRQACPTNERAVRATHPCPSLLDLAEGEHGVIAALELPEQAARRLMSLGFVPGCQVTAVRSAPAGDPRIYRVDGAEIALRNETAARIKLEPVEPRDAG